jgi:hypothetical protein
VAVVQPSFARPFVCWSFVCLCSFVRLRSFIRLRPSVVVRLAPGTHPASNCSQRWLQVLGADAGGRRDGGRSFVVEVGCWLGCGLWWHPGWALGVGWVVSGAVPCRPTHQPPDEQWLVGPGQVVGHSVSGLGRGAVSGVVTI